MLPRLAHAVLTGLLGAALLHLVIVLSLPYFTGQDAYRRVLAKGPPHLFHPVGKSEGLAPPDPFLTAAVCGFDLSAAPVRLTAAGDAAFWSLAVFDSAANETFSMNDRTALERRLDAVIATPVQAARLKKDEPDFLERTILIETARNEGYAVLRAMAPHASGRAAAQAFLGTAGCAPFNPQ